MDPSSPNILIDILANLPPEIVWYIFSFTTSAHASAAGFFTLALKPSLCVLRNQHPIIVALCYGDLPWLRYILTHHKINPDFWIHDICNCEIHVTHESVHAFKYLLTLFDSRSPLLPTQRKPALLHFYKLLRHWASRTPDQIALLNWLQTSNYARATEPSYATLYLLSKAQDLPLLRHMCEYFPKQSEKLLHFALINNWPAGLEYLHTTVGLRFSRWSSKDHRRIRKYVDGVSHTMATMGIVPADTCPSCLCHWTPLLGWWGVVLIYKLNTRWNHSCLTYRDDSVPDLMKKRSTQFYLVNATHEAIINHDEGVLSYVARWTPWVLAKPQITYSAIRANNVALLCLVKEKKEGFSKPMPQLDWRTVKTEILNYIHSAIRQKGVKRQSLMELVSALCELFPTIKPPLMKMQELAVWGWVAPDVGFLVWAAENDFKFDTKFLEYWRSEAMKRGGEIGSSFEAVDKCWKRMGGAVNPKDDTDIMEFLNILEQP